MKSECALNVTSLVLCVLIAMVSSAAAVEYGRVDSDRNYAAPSRSGSLVHTITANFLGMSHIGFAAKDPHNPHHTIAIGRMETVGNFHIEKTIEIRSDCNQGTSGMWLGCP